MEGELRLEIFFFFPSLFKIASGFECFQSQFQDDSMPQTAVNFFLYFSDECVDLSGSGVSEAAQQTHHVSCVDTVCQQQYAKKMSRTWPASRKGELGKIGFKTRQQARSTPVGEGWWDSQPAFFLVSFSSMAALAGGGGPGSGGEHGKGSCVYQ